MDYSGLSTEALIARIQELERLNRQLLDEQEQEIGLDFAWSGNLGHWYYDITTNTITFNPLKIEALGYTMAELPERVSYQFFTDKLHPEDYDTTMQAMLDHMAGTIGVYEIEYRIRAKDGSYRWFFDRGKITQRNPEGKPLFAAGIVFDITQKKEMQFELQEKNSQLRKLSRTDALTQLENRRALMDNLEREMAKADQDGTALSIVIFDVDDFKKVNDTRGHIFGDKVLAQVGSRITRNTRQSDQAGRYGGEEFLLILPATAAVGAGVIAERIRAAIQEAFAGEVPPITISGGLAQYEGQDIDQFIHAADERLYLAKHSGKNQVC